LGKPQKHVEDSMDVVTKALEEDELCTVEKKEVFPVEDKEGSTKNGSCTNKRRRSRK